MNCSLHAAPGAIGRCKRQSDQRLIMGRLRHSIIHHVLLANTIQATITMNSMMQSLPEGRWP